jgi:hypothetical protein
MSTGGKLTMRKRYRLISAAAAVAASATIAVTGLTAASASPAVSGTEHFQLMSTSPTSNNLKLIAYGSVFTGSGVDHQGSGNVDKFVFRNGSFKIRHSNGKGPQSFNPRTCLLKIDQHGTYTIVAGSGTGKFKGIGGHGTYKLHIVGIGAKKNGKCSQTKPPVAFQQIIQASGPAHS